MLPLSESHSVPNPTSAMQRTENYHLWKNTESAPLCALPFSKKTIALDSCNLSEEE